MRKILVRGCARLEDKSIDSTFRPIRVAILKTDPNGIKDDNISFSMLGIVIHPNVKKCLPIRLP